MNFRFLIALLPYLLTNSSHFSLNTTFRLNNILVEIQSWSCFVRMVFDYASQHNVYIFLALSNHWKYLSSVLWEICELIFSFLLICCLSKRSVSCIFIIVCSMHYTLCLFLLKRGNFLTLISNSSSLCAVIMCHLFCSGVIYKFNKQTIQITKKNIE